MTSDASANMPRGVQAPLSDLLSSEYEDEKLTELGDEESVTESLEALVPLLGVAALVTAVLIAVVVLAVAKSVLSIASR